MSVHVVYMARGAKMIRPILTREEYLGLRNSASQQAFVRAARNGVENAKKRLLQMNYSLAPSIPEKGAGVPLKGCTQVGNSVGMDVDHIAPEEMQIVLEKILSKKEELGLLMLEKSARGEGLHLVFKRHPELSNEENLHWASNLLGVAFDAGAKDITRVFYTTTASQDDLLYLDDELFDTTQRPAPISSSQSGKLEKNETGGNVHADGNSSPSRPITLPSQGSDGEGPGGSSYLGIPYSVLVESLQELLGGVPAHGSRNNFIFSMAAYLRYVCNDDPEWIAQVLPTYGEAHGKWRRTIESACQRAQYKQMPQLVHRAIALAQKRTTAVEAEGETQQPPQMPQKLPKLIAHLTKNVPEVCRPAVANAVFPALAAHLKDVKFWLIDGTEKEATFMCVNMAPQSSGKSAINKPIEYIVADIVERDELNRRREQEWKDATSQKGANKEKPKRPDDLCVQVLVSDMTNAAFVQRMKDANGRYLYTNLEELDLLKQLQTNGTKDVGKIICLCFDNGKYGQERVGTQSVTARVDLRWNWNASSTIQKGIKFFSGRLVDGTLSRVNFCTIIPDKTKPFAYGKYDESYADELKPYITNLNLANGHVECKQALELARKMLEKCQEDAALSDDEVLQDLAYRAVTIAYLKAMVLYICNDMTWSKEIAEFAEWSLEYDLWCKQHYFGNQISEEQTKEKVNKPKGRQNLLELLPESFTLEDALQVRLQQGLSNAANKMIKVWVHRGYIEKDATGRYVKTQTYLNRVKGINGINSIS